jgi:hypothetical protein
MAKVQVPLNSGSGLSGRNNKQTHCAPIKHIYIYIYIYICIYIICVRVHAHVFGMAYAFKKVLLFQVSTRGAVIRKMGGGGYHQPPVLSKCC